MLILHSTKLTMGAWSSVLVCIDAVLYVKSFNPPLNSLFDSDYSLSSASYFTLSLLHALREIQFTAREKYNLQCERNQFLSPHRLKYDNILFVFALYLSDAWITNWMEGGSGGRVGARVTTPTSVSPGQRGSLTSLARCCPVRSKEIQFSGLKKYN